VFRFRQIELKHEMKSYLASHPDHQSITIFEFHKSQFSKLEWEDNTEFKFKGEMYDLISQEIQKDKVIIHCIADKKETELLKSFADLMKHQNRSTSSKNSVLLQLINIVYEPVSNDLEYSSPADLPTKYTTHNSTLVENIREILTPPPRTCFA